MRRVDHGVDLQGGGHVDGAATLVGCSYQLREQRLALRAFGHGFKFLAIAQAHRAFEPHGTELSAGPGDREQRRMKTAGRHRHRAQAVALAQHHAQIRHTQMCGRDEHAADVAHLRLRLDVRANHEAGRIDQAHQRQTMRIAQLHEARCLVGRVRVNRAAQVQRVVGEQADRAALDARQRRVDALAKTSPQFKQAALIGDTGHGSAGVVNTQAVLRHNIAQGLRVRRLPVRHAPLKK